jgi:hypothetical protein
MEGSLRKVDRDRNARGTKSMIVAYISRHLLIGGFHERSSFRLVGGRAHAGVRRARR